MALTLSLSLSLALSLSPCLRLTLFLTPLLKSSKSMIYTSPREQEPQEGETEKESGKGKEKEKARTDYDVKGETKLSNSKEAFAARLKDKFFNQGGDATPKASPTTTTTTSTKTTTSTTPTPQRTLAPPIITRTSTKASNKEREKEAKAKEKEKEANNSWEGKEALIPRISADLGISAQEAKAKIDLYEELGMSTYQGYSLLLQEKRGRDALRLKRYGFLFDVMKVAGIVALVFGVSFLLRSKGK